MVNALVAHRVVEFEDGGGGQAKRLADSLLVHHGARDGFQTECGAHQADVL